MDSSLLIKSNSLSAGKRKTWLDGCRSLAMLLVVFGHGKPNIGWFFLFTSPIKLPLFFAITGYLLYKRNLDTKEFYKSLLLKICVPWLCLSLLPLKIIASIVGLLSTTVWDEIYFLISGKELWYFPCIVIAQILFYYICKVCKRTDFIVCGCVATGILGLVLTSLDILDFAKVNTALVSQIYLMIGYLFHAAEEKLGSIRWRYILLGLLGYILLGCLSMHFYPRKNLDVNVGYYYNLPLCMSMIFVGCFTVFAFAQKIGKAPKVFALIGQNTLVLYTLHGYCFGIMGEILQIVGVTMQNNWPIVLAKTIGACVVCGMISYVLNRLFPEFVGRKRIKKQVA